MVVVWDDDGAGGMWRTTGSWFLERGGTGAGDGLRRRRRGGRNGDCNGASTPRPGGAGIRGRGRGFVVTVNGAGRIWKKGSSEGRGSRAGDGLRRRGGGGVAFL